MQAYPSLEITAEFSGTDRTGRFELGPGSNGGAGWSVEHQQRTGTLVEGRGAAVLGLLSRFTDQVQSGSQSVRINAGGQRAWEIRAETPRQATDDSGNTLQWGSTSDTTVKNAHSATGADRITQADVFHRYLAKSAGDSLTPAIFEFGEHSSGGLYDPVNVAVESPATNIPGDESQVGQISLTVVQILDLNQPLSVTNRPE